MTGEIFFMLVLMVIALVAFVKEIFPIEVTALGFLAVLLGSGLLSPEEALSGFSNKAVIAIGGLFVMSHALMKTGVLERAAEHLAGRHQKRPWTAITMLLVAVGLLSGVLNNTAVVALAIPLSLKLCRQLEISPSKVLIPVSYVSIFGGTLTLIGTSTNLLVSAVAEESGIEPLGVFEFSSFGIVLLIAGLAYILIFARRWLPERAANDALTEKYRMGAYLTELVLQENSGLVGKTLIESNVNERYQVTVLELVRQGWRVPLDEVGRTKLEAEDLLIVQGNVDDILKLRRDQGIALLSDVKLGDSQLVRDEEDEQVLAEGWVAHNSRLAGKSLKELDFHQRSGGFVLAIRRVGATLREKVAHVRLQVSDSLLMLIPRRRLEELRRSDDLLILSEHEADLERERFWWLVFPVLPAVVALAAFGVLDIAAGALIGAVVLLLFGVLSPQEAYRAVDWSVIFMIAAFVPVGLAFTSTGTADFIAGGLLAVSEWASPGLAPYLTLAVIYLTTSLLTQMISNNAAAIILAPVVISLGPALGVDPRPFLFAVCFAASAEFMTPMGYQTNLMVYGAGGYRFLDYTRFGAPLNLLFWILATLLIPVIWPFTP